MFLFIIFLGSVLVEVMAQCFLGAILIFLITLVWAWLSDVLEKRHVTGWRFLSYSFKLQMACVCSHSCRGAGLLHYYI